MSAPDLLIRNVHVIDPASKVNRVADIAIADDRIVGIGDYSSATPRQSIDASGMYASPGWIDLHTHVFKGANSAGVDADRDAGIGAGVTTVVDAGSSGYLTWRTFQESVVEVADTRVLAFLNISLVPTITSVHGQWDNFSQGKTIELVEREAAEGRCLGLKVLASQQHCGDLGITPVKLARQAARLSGTGLMVHIGEAPPAIEDVLELLGEGDILTHCWHGKHGGILGRDMKPLPETLAAVERGVKFDIGHGSYGFSFETARFALDAGLPLDSISTDIQEDNTHAPVHNMAMTLTKFLHLGLELSEVIRLCTSSPATLIHMENEIGSLAIGRDADITLFRVVEEDVELTDGAGNIEIAKQCFRVESSIRSGKVIGLSAENHPS